MLTPSSALSLYANTGTDASAAIQYRLDKFPRVDGVTHARYPMGGILDLPAGVLTISNPLRLYSGVVLRGERLRTVLNYTGTDCAIILDGANHCFAGVEMLQLYSDTGGGICCADVMEYGKGDVLRDLCISTKGQAISLRRKLNDGAMYNPTLERIEFVNLGSGAIDARTINGRVSQLMLSHNPRAGFTPPACGAMLSFEWSASVEQVVAEWTCDVPFLRFASAGQGPGNFACAGLHLEPAARTDGKIVPVMIVDNAVLDHAATLFYGTATCPIVLRNGAKLNAKIVTDGSAVAVKVDETSAIEQGVAG